MNKHIQVPTPLSEFSRYVVYLLIILNWIKVHEWCLFRPCWNHMGTNRTIRPCRSQKKNCSEVKYGTVLFFKTSEGIKVQNKPQVYLYECVFSTFVQWHLSILTWGVKQVEWKQRVCPTEMLGKKYWWSVLVLQIRGYILFTGAASANVWLMVRTMTEMIHQFSEYLANSFILDWSIN